MLEEVLLPIFVNLIIFGSISFIVYTIVTTRNRERMAIIEKGLDLSLLINKSNSNGNGWRRFSILLGCLLIGIAIGFVTGVTISNVFYSAFHEYRATGNSSYYADNSGHVIFAMVFLFGGIGMITSTFINKKLDKKD